MKDELLEIFDLEYSKADSTQEAFDNSIQRIGQFLRDLVQDEIGTSIGHSLDDTLAGRANTGKLVQPNDVVFAVDKEFRPGASAWTYLAHDPKTQQQVVLKIHRANESQLFDREVGILSLLSHRYIPKIYRYGRVSYRIKDRISRRTGFVQEYVPATSLAEFMKSNPVPTSDWTARYMLRVARTLSDVSRLSVLHRDIKPDNLLVVLDGTDSGSTPEPEPRVIDFGIARKEDQSFGETLGSVLGTEEYMSPEILTRQGHSNDDRSDIWSFGVVLYELLAGMHPFTRCRNGKPKAFDEQLAREASPRSLATFGVSRDLRAICSKCLEKDPADRYQSFDNLASDLERYVAGQPIEAELANPIVRLKKWTKRNPVLAAVISAASLIALSLTTWAMFERGNAMKGQASAEASFDKMFDLLDQQVSAELTSDPFITIVDSEQIAEAITYYENLGAASLDPKHPDRSVRLLKAYTNYAFANQFEKNKPNAPIIEKGIVLANTVGRFDRVEADRYLARLYHIKGQSSARLADEQAAYQHQAHLIDRDDSAANRWNQGRNCFNLSKSYQQAGDVENQRKYLKLGESILAVADFNNDEELKEQVYELRTDFLINLARLGGNEAVGYMDKAVALCGELVADAPDDLGRLRALGRAEQELAIILGRHDLKDQQEEVNRRLVGTFERIFKTHQEADVEQLENRKKLSDQYNNYALGLIRKANQLTNQEAANKLLQESAPLLVKQIEVLELHPTLTQDIANGREWNGTRAYRLFSACLNLGGLMSQYTEQPASFWLKKATVTGEEIRKVHLDNGELDSEVFQALASLAIALKKEGKDFSQSLQEAFAASTLTGIGVIDQIYLAGIHALKLGSPEIDDAARFKHSQQAYRGLSRAIAELSPEYWPEIRKELDLEAFSRYPEYQKLLREYAKKAAAK